MSMAISTDLPKDSAQIERWRHEFARTHYGIVRGAISPDAAAIAVSYMQILYDYYQPTLMFDERQQSYGRYNDPLGESVLGDVWPKVKALSGLDLLPTYSFLRMYRHGGVLRKHVDRPSCEVSATLFLGSDATWPIGVEVDGEARLVHLEPGDLMLYRGCEVPHWRDAFGGQYSVHMFLHFVEAGGANAHLLYDERAGLGAPQMRAAPIRDREGRMVRENAPDAAEAAANPNGRVRRNEPCPCGSGKRYKNCHGAK